MARDNCTRAYVEASQTRMFRDWRNRASVTSSFFARSSDFLAFVDLWIVGIHTTNASTNTNSESTQRGHDLHVASIVIYPQQQLACRPNR